MNDLAKTVASVAEDSPLSVWISGKIVIQPKQFEPMEASLMVQRFVNRENPPDEVYLAEIAKAQSLVQQFLDSQYKDLTDLQKYNLDNGLFYR
jgi:hypothetical protein